MARLTFLIGEELKRELARVSAEQDLTTSQLLRRLIGEYLDTASPVRRQRVG